MADDKIKALSARHRRIETKLAALRAKAFGLNDVLHRAFEGTDIVGISCTVTLEQIRYDE